MLHIPMIYDECVHEVCCTRKILSSINTVTIVVLLYSYQAFIKSHTWACLHTGSHQFTMSVMCAAQMSVVHANSKATSTCV